MSEARIAEQHGLESLVGRVADEFLGRQEAGERPDVEEYVARYPQAADLLRKVLASLQLLGASLAGGEPTPTGGDEPPGTLGDFRIIREVGRGGMGVVYEAEQISLGRRVALKVLPFAATMDARQLQRFHNEARAAACLHHTNIVPVHAVGQERGVHYYAMQFIEGRTLAALIDEQRGAALSQVPTGSEPAAASATTARDALRATSAAPPDAAYFRQVADWGIQAAEALDCAHTLGVVHRDVKPANLLVDAAGRLWITDFGLAQVQSDTRLTMTGDLVGTLRYMSPEQALAKRVVVDHRTDIYSLGATLYELLTLEPAYSGKDRQELLRQIAFEEPRPLRRDNRGVPADLETIVLKALEKNPADRYATAQELAEDLRRWLADRPIQARRPSWRQVAVRWARRHKPLLGAAALVLLLAAVFGGSAGLWWVQMRARAEGEARAAVREAVQLQQEEKWSEAQSAIRRAEGALAGFGADWDLWQEIAQLGKDLEMARRLEEARLQATAVKDGHFDHEASAAAYADAFQWYGVGLDGIDPQEAGERLRLSSIRVQLAAALDNWAWVRRMLNDSSWKHLVAIARVADPDPWRNQFRDTWERRDIKALEDLAASARTDELPPATACLLDRVAWRTAPAEWMRIVLRQVQQRHPADFWLNQNLGLHLLDSQPPHLEEAHRYLAIAVALRPGSPGAHLNLGDGLGMNGQLDEAIVEYREALRIKQDYADAHLSLGNALRRKGQLDEAIAEYREALRIKPDHAFAHNNLGNVLRVKGQLDEAIAEYREALRIKKDYPDAHNNLGIALLDKGQLDEAIAEYREALRIKKDNPGAHNNLGNALLDKGQLDEAIAEYREALRIKKDYPEAHNNLGNALAVKGQPDEAIAEYREALRLKPNYARAHYNLGSVLMDRGQLDEALAAYREAIRLKPDYASAHNNLGNVLKDRGQLDEALAAYREAIRLRPDDAIAHNNLGAVLMDRGQLDEALAAYREAIRLKNDFPVAHTNLASALKLESLRDRLPPVLQGKAQPKDVAERLAFADFCQQPFRQQYVAAARFYQEAFAADPKLADDLQGQPRYNAACAAALAGCGQGKDADQSDHKERARLRRQALEWLQADLAAYRRLLDKEPERAGSLVRERMQHWQQDKDFAGVRGPDALARLPEAERATWQQLWADVAAMLTRAKSQAAANTSGTKH
jgi:tetratricopeptide (TPR) repeat protein